ncbi:MAG: ABC transporter permease, partial [Bacteroidetes bacterium]|nr:ABC transporter permease [Bacteroidota bacterium]
MLGNYIKIAIRYLIKQRTVTIINLGGLSLSIGIAILILLYIQNEFSYDKFNRFRDRIYIVRINDIEHMPSGVGIDLQENILEIENTVRFTVWGSGLVKYPVSGEPSQSLIIQNPVFTDSTVFDIFSFSFISGNVKTALNTPFSIVLTESMSKKIFNDKNPIGKVVQVENSMDYTVTGVIEDVHNFHIPIDVICSFSSLTAIYGQEFNYRYDDGWQHPTYVLLPEKHNRLQVENKINQFFKERKIFEDPHFQLVSLNRLYFTNKVGKKGNLQSVYLFLIMAVLIICIASLNYINLTTASSGMRSMEVGLKKVVGAHKIQLLMQFLIESVMLSLVAMILGFIIAELLVPVFNNLISGNLQVKTFYSFPSILYFISGSIFLGILSGLYPAYNFISFNPLMVLKGERTKGKKGINLRRSLITFQFSVSTILIILTLSVFKQIHYMKHRDLGFMKERTLVLDPVRALKDSKSAIKDELLYNPDVLSVSYSCFPPGGNFWYWTVSANDISSSVRINAVDPDFINLYSLKIMQGRDFNWNRPTDKDNKFIINEKTAKLFELKDPVGKILEDGPNGDGEIIGIIEDFHFISLHHDIQPLILYWLDWPHRVINIKISGQNIEETMNFIEATWNRFSAVFPFSYSFLDESFDIQYRSEEQLVRMFGFFAMLALIIACSGLLGLSLFMAERRTKEIGIRRTFGATVNSIALAFISEITVLIGISILIALPLSWFFLQGWMKNFSFQTKLSWWIFVLAGIISILTALSTV